MRRRTLTRRYKCKAPILALAGTPWEETPKEIRDQIEAMHGMNCDGGGIPGSWCERSGGCVWDGGYIDLDDEVSPFTEK